jgi:hypothetical protein
VLDVVRLPWGGNELDSFAEVDASDDGYLRRPRRGWPHGGGSDRPKKRYAALNVSARSLCHRARD